MPELRGLTIIVATGDGERFRAALTLAAAHAALGGRTRVYLHEGAVPLIATGDALLTTAMEIGATLIVCQTGMAASGLDARDLPSGVETGGLVALLADLGEDRLTTL
ncbi:MAG: peroxiredoxin [Sphingomonas sp.]